MRVEVPHQTKITIQGLYAKLVNTIELLESDKINIRTANAIANVAGKAIDCIWVSLEYERMKNQRLIDHLLPMAESNADENTSKNE